ncbi:MAG: treS, partial [Variovorax sp.]|nr:treS [Variovorax sp.]
GADALYFLPLALAWEEQEEERLNGLAPAALAKVRQQANVGVMGDAFYDEAFCRAMVQSIGAGLELPTAQGRLRFRPTAAFASLAGAGFSTLPVSRPSALSSNTVVNLDERLFLKGYRLLRPGLNPELEMGRFLTEVVAYPNCVPVAGALEYFGNDGRVMTLALVQAYVSNQGSGWDYTLGYLERFLDEVRTASDELPPDVHGGFLALARLLGRRTAELHRALATRTGDPAFDPEAVTSEDVLAWRERARREVEGTLGLLRERMAELPPAVREDAQALLLRHGALQARLAGEGIAAGTAGPKTRYHGDYHLGQLLVTDNDFVIIDFEGEPARSFDERRAKGSPLRDVAGMLRSFNYARWSALKRVAQSAGDLVRLDAAVRAWEKATCAAFLAGYGEGAPAVDAGLLALFQLEKACYELRYELNNRVDWVQVPLHGILALLDDSAAG